MSTRIAVLLTVYNRRATTLACLRALYAQSLPMDHELVVYLVDDGSTDGTTAAVNAAFPEVKVIPGDGNLFWCNGMRLAWQHAARSKPDFYLWLNDDTMLLPGAVMLLLDSHKQACQTGTDAVIVVGACRDPLSGKRSYAGKVRPGAHPLILRDLEPTGQIQTCDTFQGNCILVCNLVYERVGTLDTYQHGFGDIDYGYRAGAAACAIFMTPEYVAECVDNPCPSYWYKGHSRRERWRLLNSRKGMPPTDWYKFVRRHCGWKWLLFWPRPYLRVILNR
ncbi:MAG: glycosyltransferase family 2 protein [Phycisphaerae bacterium]